MTGENDGEPTVNNSDQTAMLSRIDGLAPRERLRDYGSYLPLEDRPADLATGLVSLAFIRAAIRRSVRLWCALAVAGLLIGLGYSIASPPAYQASTAVLLTFGPYENPTSAAVDDQTIAQSRAVAGLAVHKLGLRQTASNFLAEYTVTALSDRVLQITASGPSAKDAVRWANAVAAAFLRYRAGELEFEQNLMLASLRQQTNQASQEVSRLSKQISQLAVQPASTAQQAQLSGLRAQRSQWANTLYTLEQSGGGGEASRATTLAVKGSKVLVAAAPIPHSRLKSLLSKTAIGLVLGLVLGVGIGVVRELMSDRLRRRDDIARALGAAVKLSVGPVRLRWHAGRHRLERARGDDIQRIVAHLHSTALASTTGAAAALAIVPADDPHAAALSLVSLATSCAQQGHRVVVADLYSRTPAARLMGAGEPGVRAVRMGEGSLVVAVPGPSDVLPVGPLASPTTRLGQGSPFTEAVAAAWASADLLLTLADLDASLGGAHLVTWAATAVAMVTAGKSSATRLSAVGEMVRLAGTRLDSAVLIGADRSDDSIGVTYTPHDYSPGRVWGPSP